MALYEYVCKECNKEFDRFIPLVEADEVDCPDCGIRATRKISTFHLRKFPIKSVKVGGEEVR